MMWEGVDNAMSSWAHKLWGSFPFYFSPSGNSRLAPALRPINISLNWAIKESNLCVFKNDTGNPVPKWTWTLNLMLCRFFFFFFFGELEVSIPNNLTRGPINEYLNFTSSRDAIKKRLIDATNLARKKYEVTIDVCHRYLFRGMSQLTSIIATTCWPLRIWILPPSLTHY